MSTKRKFRFGLRGSSLTLFLIATRPFAGWPDHINTAPRTPCALARFGDSGDPAGAHPPAHPQPADRKAGVGQDAPAMASSVGRLALYSRDRACGEMSCIIVRPGIGALHRLNASTKLLSARRAPLTANERISAG